MLSSSPRVLVVEDHPVNQKVFSRMLERLGCTVDLAEDGEVGVEKAALSPDLILMDCNMPRCDGFEATRRIRALPAPTGRVPIVALTANAMPIDRERCLAAGMNEWLSKPVSPEDLGNVLRRTLGWTPEAAGLSLQGALDARTLHQLLDLAADDPEFLPGVVSDFEKATREALHAARLHLEADEIPELRRVLHRMKGASGTVGALALQSHCRQLEAASDLQLRERGTEGLDTMMGVVDATLTALRRACEESS